MLASSQPVFPRKSIAQARSFFIGGAALLLGVLGVCWLMFGHIDRRALSFAVGISALVELLGVYLFVTRQRATKPDRPELALVRKLRLPRRTTLEIQFCKASLLRLETGMDLMLDALKERGHSSTVRECLNRCMDCKQGQLMVNVDGIPLSVSGADQLLSDLDALSGKED